MKRALYIFILAILSQVAFSQSTTFDTIYLVSDTTIQASSTFSIDIDGDDDFDIITGSMEGPGVTWHENVGGEISTEQNIVSDIVDTVAHVFAIDMDGDEDIDIVAASPTFPGYNVFWYKNTGGGNFGSELLISSELPGAWSVYAADLNDDESMDVISASEVNATIGWFANDGAGNFGSFQVVSDTAFGASSVFAEDLDNNGHMDIIAGYGNRVSWFRNNGSGGFNEERLLTEEAYDVRSVSVGDMNGDDNIDVLSASFGDSKIAWYQNLGYSNFYEEQRIISVLAIGATDLFAADFDGDNDLDVVSSSAMDSRIIWYQNVLDQEDDLEFKRYPLTNSTSGASSVYAADIDIDGDQDIIAASADDNKIRWMKNDFDFVFNWYYEFCEGDTILVINGEEIISTDTVSDTLQSIHGRDSVNIYYVLFNPKPLPFEIEGPTEVNTGDTIVYRVNTSPNVLFMWDIENGEQVSYGISDTIAVWWKSSETGMGKITSLGYYFNPNPENICFITEELDVVINPAGLSEHRIDEVSVYPNPANTMLYINNFKQDYSIHIYNSSGVELMQVSEKNIDISALKSGLHFVQIIDEKSELVKVSKLIIN